MINRLPIISLIALLCIVSCETANSEKPADIRKPNILFIVADDLGVMDIGAYNPDCF